MINANRETTCPRDGDPRAKTIHQQRVEEFMRKAQQEVPDSVTTPSLKVRILRAKLIFSECVKELIGLGLGVSVSFPLDRNPGGVLRINDLEPIFAADSDFDMKETVDGCADGIVVITGTLSACGVADLGVQKEVDEANLRKFELPKCPDHGAVGIVHFGSGNYECQFHDFLPSAKTNVRCGRVFKGPYRDEDGKWVKAPNFRPPDIERVLLQQGYNPKPSRQPEALTYEEMKVACLNIGVDLDCGACASLFYTGSNLGETHSCQNPKEGLVISENNFIAQMTSGKPKDALCNHCKNPLSDELVRVMKKENHRAFQCPNCQGVINLREVTHA